MAELRRQPPSEVGGATVLQVVDLIDGTGVVAGTTLPPSNVLIYPLDGARLIIRPSGTEPKIKAYIESVDAVRDTARSRMAEIAAAAEVLLSSS